MKNSVRILAVTCLFILANCNSPKKNVITGSWQVVREDTIGGPSINTDDLNSSIGKNTRTVYVFNENHTVQYIEINGRDTTVENGRFEVNENEKTLEISSEAQKEDTIHAVIVEL